MATTTRRPATCRDLFALLAPLLLVMMSVVVGARAIAGDEEAGTLELLLAHPVSRTRLVIERFGALAGAVILLGAVVWIGTVAAVAGPDMGIARAASRDHLRAGAAGTRLWNAGANCWRPLFTVALTVVTLTAAGVIEARPRRP